jgi:outer membrane protein assembly factor BamD
MRRNARPDPVSNRAMKSWVLGITVVLCACGSGGFKPDSFPSTAALMEASEQLFRTGKCNKALEGFEQLSARLPSRDSIGVRARFLLGECHYDRGEYLEAARQFRRVSEEAPDSRLAAAALLRAGDAHRELWKHPDLDPTYGETALATYRELVARYPGTPTARRAGSRILQLNTDFAEKNYRNGVFYRRLKAYHSAILYFKNVVALYGETEYAPRALVELVDIYDRLDYDEERVEICQHLRQFYPNADGVDDRCSVAPS